VASSDLVPSSDAAPRWDLLAEQPPSKERLSVRTALSGRHPDVLIGLDAAFRRHVLVRIPAGEEETLTERGSRGLGIRSVRMVPRDTGAEESFVEISCLDPQGYAALDLVIGELVEAVERSEGVPRVRLVQGVLAKWRRFWSGVPVSALSIEAQIGLFGELYFLSRWLCDALGPTNAVSTWRGPAGARNDFESPGLGIEAKTTKRVDAVHVIHGLDQLIEPTGGILLLFALSVRDEGSATESLPKLVSEVRLKLAGDAHGLDVFDKLLYAAGYDDRQEGEYNALLLRVRSEVLYRVCDGFPRLVPDSITCGVPPGVSNVTYELRIDAADSWMIANAPATARKLLQDLFAL
jgi:hypothetical protein